MERVVNKCSLKFTNIVTLSQGKKYVNINDKMKVAKSISKSSCILDAFSKKIKERQNIIIQQKFYLPRLPSSFSIQGMTLGIFA